MNKKLQEYCGKKARATADKAVPVNPDMDKHDMMLHATIGAAYNNGFNAAIELDLAVEFAKWKDENVAWHDKHTLLVDDVPTQLYKYDGKLYELAKLYNYWIDNIFKLE